MSRRTRASCSLVALVAACTRGAPPAEAPLVATIGPASSAVAPSPVAPRDDAPLDALTVAVRRFIERGEPQALFAMMADDIHVRSGRARQPSSYDAIYGKSRLVALDGWAADNEVHTTLRIVSPRFESTGRQASVEWMTIMTQTDPAKTSAFGESYRLELRNGAWKIVRFEYWPLVPDTLEEFDSEFWATTDEKIEEARKNADARTLAYQLMVGYRFDECNEVSRRLTEAHPDDAWSWGMRATASALVGDQIDAQNASDEKRRLEAHPPPTAP